MSASDNPAHQALRVTTHSTTGRVRSAWVSVEIMLVLVAAHVWAGGSLPALPWLGAMLGLVYGATRALARGHLARTPAAVALLIAQFALHHLLAALSPHGQHGHGDVLASLTPKMASAHLVAGVVTWLLWRLRTRALAVVLHWSRWLRSTVQTPPRLVPLPRHAPVLSQVRILTAPLRGPPRYLLSV